MQPKEFNHTLIIGGTGMLRTAAIALATRSARLTSVARTQHSLELLHAALPASAGKHHQLALDWSQPDKFLGPIAQHLAATSPPDLAVAWIHADRLGLQLAGLLAAAGERVRYFHIIGSARENPLAIADQLLRQLRPVETLTYHQVILGAHGSGALVRWLTDEEISTGVLAAIDSAKPRTILGSLAPWGVQGLVE